ncbi:metallohydrolase [Sorangium sp. So ce118]
MTAIISFFPVDNGDMTLIELQTGRTLAIDVNIRTAADDPDDATPDVAAKLRKRLKRDQNGRLYVDAFLLSHPDQDHCRGLERHFHLGAPSDWSKDEDKIFIREIWSSPMVFRRASKNIPLCKDAKAFNTEARRRVKRFRDVGGLVSDGDRILILGEDENGKTDDLKPILIKTDEEFSRVNGELDWSMKARLLAPLPKSDEETEEVLSKNQSSTILQISLHGDYQADACLFLTGGDAEVAIWERLWARHKSRPDWLKYDILLAPHHCSWHSISYDSWSNKGKSAKVCDDARSALSQTRRGAAIIASSGSIKDDYNDPPCIRAKQEYEEIVKAAGGSFRCVCEHPSVDDPDVTEYEVGRAGPRLKSAPMRAPAIVGGAVGGQPLPHG